jgi:hypothetical protein
MVAGRAEGPRIVRARRELVGAYQAVLATAETQLASFLSGVSRVLLEAQGMGKRAAQCDGSVSVRHADKVTLWQRHQCLNQPSDDDTARQLDVFQPECELLAGVLTAARDQLRRMHTMHEHLSLKGDAGNGPCPLGGVT